MTIREALNLAIELLRTRTDIADWATRDANLLLQHVLGLSRAQMLAGPEKKISDKQHKTFRKLIDHRLQAVPIQHLTGTQEFYGRAFRVTRDVLIPRPETELIVDQTLALIDNSPSLSRDSDISLTDVGTGSGILAITLAAELPNAIITAIDISPNALAVAHANAAVHRVMRRIRFIESDLLAAIVEPQDIIVSNPPYIGRNEAAAMHPQVLEHEPELALFADEMGDAIYHRLIPEAFNKLKPGGYLLLELGTQGQRLTPLFSNWQSVRYAQDLQDIDRVLIAQKL